MGKRAVTVVFVIVGALVAVVALPALFLQTNKVSAEARIKQMAEEAKLPTTTAQLYPAPTIPDDQNAFMLVSQIQAASRQGTAVKVDTPKSGEAWDYAALRKSVDSHPDMLALAEEAAQRPQWVPVRTGEGPNILFPEFATVKPAIKALAERQRLRAAEGDLEGAVKDADSSLKLADLVREEPVLIAGLVSIACHAIANVTIADTVGQIRHDRAAMDHLVEVVDRPLVNDFHHLFLGEATMSYYMATRRVKWSELGFEGNPRSPEATLRDAKMELDRPYWGPILVKGWVDYLKQAKEHPADIDANQKALGELEKLGNSKDDRLVVLQILFPVFSQAFDAYRKEMAQHEILSLAVHAIRDGRLPEVTGTRDPFSGGAYKLVRQNGGWRIYSLGTDRKDDGGTTTVGTIDSEKNRNDIVFSWDGKSASLKGR